MRTTVTYLSYSNIMQTKSEELDNQPHTKNISSES